MAACVLTISEWTRLTGEDDRSQLMATLTVREALSQALWEEMESNPKIILLGLSLIHI